jgi:hypothetical protein
MANKIFQDDYLLLETDDFRNITARFNGFKREAISPIKLLRQAKYKTMFFTLFEIELDGVNTRFIINGKSKNNTKEFICYYFITMTVALINYFSSIHLLRNCSDIPLFVSIGISCLIGAFLNFYLLSKILYKKK